MRHWEWTPTKNDQTLARRAFDFEHVIRIFQRSYYLEASDRFAERRWQVAVGGGD
jgi:hypothetical protein